MRIPKFIFAPLSIVLLCLGSALVATAQAVATTEVFTAGIDYQMDNVAGGQLESPLHKPLS